MPTIDLRVGPVYYESFGAGFPLLFLSGLGGDLRAFSATLRYFATTHRAFGIDVRDAGRSVRVDADYSLEVVARDVIEWMDQLEIDQLDLVGHSMGGLTAQVIASQWPERVRSLVLASTHAGGDPWRKAVVASWLEMRTLADPAQFSRWTLPWLTSRQFFREPASLEGMVRFAEKDPFRQPPDAFARQARAVIGFDGVDYSRLTMPTLVLVGENDLVNPPAVTLELASRIRGSAHVILAGVGHLPHVEQPNAFREAIERFLTQRA